MTGLKYHRMKANMTQEQLARAIGVSVPVIMRHETSKKINGPAAMYQKISKVLKLTVDDLIATYPDDSLPGTYAMPKNQKANNIIALYMAEKHHTTRTLGTLLNVSRQTVSTICRAEVPDTKYISKLAEFEGLTEAEFIKLYKVA